MFKSLYYNELTAKPGDRDGQKLMGIVNNLRWTRVEVQEVA